MNLQDSAILLRLCKKAPLGGGYTSPLPKICEIEVSCLYAFNSFVIFY